jgi:hypothetical protein
MDKGQLDLPKISTVDQEMALRPDAEINQFDLPKEGGQE